VCLSALVCASLADTSQAAEPAPYRIGVRPVITVDATEGCADHTNPNNGRERHYTYEKDARTFFQELDSYTREPLQLLRVNGRWELPRYTNRVSTPDGAVQATFGFGTITVFKEWDIPEQEIHFNLDTGELTVDGLLRDQFGDLCVYPGRGNVSPLRVVACTDPLPVGDLVWWGACPPSDLDFELEAVEPVQVTYHAAALVAQKPMAVRVTVKATSGNQLSCDPVRSALAGQSVDVGLKITNGAIGEQEFLQIITAADFQDFSNTGMGCIARVYLATNYATAGGSALVFRAVVNASASVSEVTRTNNEKSTSMSSVDTRALRVVFVPMTPCAACGFAPSSNALTNIAAARQRAQEELSALFPIAINGYSDSLSQHSYVTNEKTTLLPSVGLLIDLLELATLGKRVDPFADVAVGVAPNGYLPWRGQGIETFGVTVPFLAPSVIVSEVNDRPVVTHEIGHQLGLYSGVKITVAGVCVRGCEEYETTKGLQLTEGYWAGPQGFGEVRGAVCFMSSPPVGQTIGNQGIWIHPDDYNALLTKLISPTDPAALWVTGWIQKTGEVSISATYYFPAASLTDNTDTAAEALSVITTDGAGTVLSQLRIPIQFAVQDAPSLQQVDAVPFGVMIPLTSQTVSVQVRQEGSAAGGTVIRPFEQALQDAILRIPDSSFGGPSPHARQAMLAEAAQYARMIARDQRTAARSLLQALRGKATTWLSAQTPVDPRSTSRAELIALIDVIATAWR
jgi:hypothetical protein